eukprot:CAMPEP_0116830850 /NCGR_PEP_ID=MMETSP0418-20121206/4997_1 /TAXON_ID=1158023 /ORGANISM="Astrosyne radiata, Strain 13vi08-1A" /LENGTH=68 /DNA_ID=CAMNT_0004460009 /DNA_START=1040 /DNA_END=1246 /DNA_ORIENTATION=-
MTQRSLSIVETMLKARDSRSFPPMSTSGRLPIRGALRITWNTNEQNLALHFVFDLLPRTMRHVPFPGN